MSPVIENKQAGVSSYKDRSTGMLVFGIIFLLLAGLCAMVGMLGLSAGLAAAGEAGAKATMGSVALVYGGVAFLFAALGSGSIRGKRWSRPLILIVSAVAVVFSTISLTMGAIFVSDFAAMLDSEFAKVPDAGLPDGMGYIILAMMGAFFFFAGVVFPAVLFLFYRSPHVKATCEAKDEKRRWTDACPVPVLALVVLVSVNALFVLLTPFTSKGFFPFFGEYLIGLPGAIGCLLVASVLFYAVWRCYYLDELGWWLILLVSTVQSVSQVMTMLQADFGELYRMLGYTSDMIEELVKTQELLRGFNTANAAAFGVAGLVFLIWVKGYFSRAERAMADD